MTRPTTLKIWLNVTKDDDGVVFPGDVIEANVNRRVNSLFSMIIIWRNGINNVIHVLIFIAVVYLR